MSESSKFFNYENFDDSSFLSLLSYLFARLTEELKVKSEEKKQIIGEVENRQAAVENLKPLVGRISEAAKPAYKLLDIEGQPADVAMEQ